MKNKILQSISFKIFFFYTLLSVVTISFVISIIFENQVDLIAKNIQLESENQLSKLINSMKKFTYESQQGRLFDIRTNKEALNQIIKFIGPHFEDYLIFTEKGAVTHTSRAGLEIPKSLIEDGLRSITAKTFSGLEYYLRIDEEKKMMYCYISLNEFRLGNSILLLQKNIGTLNRSLKSMYSQAIYVLILVLLFHIIFALILFLYIIHPLNLLNTGVRKFSEGDFSARISVKRKDEFNALAEAFNKMSESIEGKMKSLSGQIETVKESKEKIENLSIRDELTGLYNRTYIIERANEELKRARFKNDNAAFLLVDLDRFNEINKIYGHQTGNIILMETAKTIVLSCTDAEIVGRFGGEEFAVLSFSGSLKYIQDIAEGIRSAIENKIIITPDGKFSTTVSVGISFIAAGQINADEKNFDLPGSAEKALLRAKENGRNRVETLS